MFYNHTIDAYKLDAMHQFINIRKEVIQLPNWCENTLTVSGKEKDIKEFKDKAVKTTAEGESEAISFNSFIPVPFELKNTQSPVPSTVPQIIRDDLIKRFGYDNWYDWCLGNWGTKWDAAYTSLIKDGARQLIYSFETAWAPPMLWLNNVSLMFPKLRFRLKYDEPGMCFKGLTKVINGEIMIDRQSDY